MVKAATLRQKRVAQRKVESLLLDNPPTDGEIVEASGYGPSMKKNPQVIMNSVGVKNELKALGFHEDNAKRVVGEILDDETNEPKDRLKASELIFKVHGSFAPDKHLNMNVDLGDRGYVEDVTQRVINQMREDEAERNA